MGYLDAMYAIIKRCKIMARIALEEGEREREKQMERERRGSVTTGIGGRSVRGNKGDGGIALSAMWKERGSRAALIIASQFIEMKVCAPPSPLTILLTVWSMRRRDPSDLPLTRSSRLLHASLPHSAHHSHPNCAPQ